MKNAIALIAIAGIASAAAAQSASFSIVPSVTTIDSTVSTSFTLSVYVDADFGTHIAGGEFALSAANAGAPAVNDMTGVTAAWGALGLNDRGHSGAGNYDGLVFGQLIFPPFIAPSVDSALSGQVLAGIITVTLDTGIYGWIDWSIATGAGAFAVEVFDDADGSFTRILDATGTGASVHVVPAPSAMALLGLGGLVAGRRRR